ncbi:hypothetical protein K525DRAFT_195506 [Schizophyllum commune Loenen D]|nr:hypothetical protein K525DRAFT_195506 [Schizophyllum commune Loenen D]
MTRRSKPKRARYTYIQPSSREPHAYHELFSIEIWHLIFSECTPYTLLAVRDTCRLFRTIVDRNDGALLARAPLNFPFHPPDPREFMRYTRHPYKIRAMRDMFGITDPWKPGCYGSAQYTKLLFLPGRCYMCKAPTDGPPAYLIKKIYLCSVRRSSVSVELRKETRYLPTGARKIDRHITPWLARVSMTKSRTHVVVLASELLAARKEYRREVLAHPVTERKQLHEALSKVSHIRRVRACALTYFVENYLDLWAGKMGHARKQVEKANKQRLRHEAARRGMPLSQVLSNLLVQRSVKAHTRDLRLIPSSVLTNAGIPRKNSSH